MHMCEQSLSAITHSLWMPNGKNLKFVENQRNIVSSLSGHVKFDFSLFATNNHCFQVSYPILMKKTLQLNPQTNNGQFIQLYHCTIQTQFHSTLNYDPNWSFPLQLVTSVNNMKTQSQSTSRLIQDELNESKQCKDKQNTNCNNDNNSGSNNSSDSEMKEINRLILPISLPNQHVYSRYIDNNNNNRKKQNRQLQQRLEKSICSTISPKLIQSLKLFHCLKDGVVTHDPICVEWNKQLNAVFRIFNDTNIKEKKRQCKIEIFIIDDESYIITCPNDTSYYHFIGQNKYVYFMGCVPPLPPNHKQIGYDLIAITNHATKLVAQFDDCVNKTNNDESKSGIIFNSIKTNSINISSNIKQYRYIGSIGQFKQFGDGTCKVSFNDKTILQMSSDGKKCRIIDKTGHEYSNIYSNTNNIMFKKYINHCQKFYHWCKLTPRQRMQAQQQRLKLQNQINADMTNTTNFIQTLIQTQNFNHDHLFDLTNITNTQSQHFINTDKDLAFLHDLQNEINKIDTFFALQEQ